MSNSGPRPIGQHRVATIEDDPDDPGWQIWKTNEVGRFLDIFGDVRLKQDGDNRVRCRIDTEPRHANGFGAVHGGFMTAVADQSLFWTCHLLNRFPDTSIVSLEVSTHLMSSARIGEPLDAVVDILRETGRLVFLRGLIEQDGDAVASFTGTVSKVSRKPASK